MDDVLKELMSINSRLGMIEGKLNGVEQVKEIIDETRNDVVEIKTIIEQHQELPARVEKLEQRDARRAGVLMGLTIGSGSIGAGLTKLLERLWP